MNTETGIENLKGIGEKTAACFNRLHLYTVSDLLNHYPVSYERYEEPLSVSAASLRDFAAVRGVLREAPVTRYLRGMKITDAVIFDEFGERLPMTWFNMPYLSKSLKTNTFYIFRGKFNGYGNGRKLQQPQIFKEEDYEKYQKTLQPHYRLTRGLSHAQIQKAIAQVLASDIEIPETMPSEVIENYHLLSLPESLKAVHFPEDRAVFQKARRRIVFEEFYRFLYDVRSMKEAEKKDPNAFPVARAEEIDRLISKLPYELTEGQRNVLSEIFSDVSSDTVMNRLIQGDVGSGKTIVAFLAMYASSLSGYQSLLMAPTEVLAIQHYENFLAMNREYELGLSISLLTGSMTAKEKKEVYEKTKNHQTDIVVGTHALITDKTEYADLGLVVTDEQHRFGVHQRELLMQKGKMPHVLNMSATPIPRTLAMILYGDMSVSVLRGMPAKRKRIKNALVDISYRAKAYHFIQEQINEGHQAYVICPMISASEAMDTENVLDYEKNLKNALAPSVRIGVLHGQMKNEEKEEVMAAFSENRIQVLVSTTVIEVGIDVPNATVILIENAERFGLSTLHQLRGRVGRSEWQSYCILVDTTQSEESKKRLQVLADSNDGFFIAEEDLKLRGPGDFFGIRQSGELAFSLGDIYTDSDIMKEAEKAVSETYGKWTPETKRVIL